MKRRTFLASALMTLPVLGCSAGKGSLKGNVTVGGRLLSMGSVAIIDDTGASTGAEIQSDGTYHIPDTPNGKYKVAVSSIDPAVQAAFDATLKDPARGAPSPGANPNPAPVKDRINWIEIPARYSDPEASGLTVEISGATEYNIPLSNS